MTLAFHYHIPAIQKEDGIYMPGYLATFIDGLAKKCDTLICYLHTPIKNELKQMDYKLTSTNIELVSIGKHIGVFKRVLYSTQFIKQIEQDIKSRSIDLMLMRAPSPLLPFVTKVCIDNNIKYSYLIVGDYVKNLKESKNIKPIKRFILNIFYKYNRYYQDKYSQNTLLFTNNPIIAQEYKSFNIKEIRTTTLSEKDFYYDETFYKNKKLNILYAGRIEPSKGIEDILNAVKILVNKGIDVTFNLVGWDASKGEVHLKYLQNKVEALNLSKNFIFHGKKQVGIELFTMYRQSDIYIIATRGDEGFPRTIWEAMANSSVVISTKAGSIPIILKDKENTILVDKNSPEQISESIIELLQNLKLVNKLQENGFALAQTNTIEKQSSIVISKIKEFINEK